MNRSIVLLILFSAMSMITTMPIDIYAADSLYCQLADPNSFFYKNYCARNAGLTAPAASATIAPTGRASNTVMQELVLPTEKPSNYAKAFNLKKDIGPMLRYENIDLDKNNSDEGADVYGTSLIFAQDMDNLSVGVIIPYDYMLFNDSTVDDIKQIGTMLFAQYRVPIMDEQYMVALSTNVNYFFAKIDFEDKGDDDLNSVGAGLGATFKVLRWNTVVPTFGVSYQYQNDDTDVSDHHLFKTGLNLAWLPAPKWALNAFGIWNADLTDYDPGDNDEFWDLGIEVNFQATQTWNLSLGYKKVVALEDFDSDQIYIGAVWKF